jgi:sugar/nucleoside kinase (ribokinase family)
MNRAATAPACSPLLLTVGRINLDLYVDALGVPMADATGFRASVGGSPTNIAIVAQRLGLPSAVLSATGDDFAADLVVTQLARFGVDTRWVQRSSEGATSLALLATLAPDVGERQFYRHDPADAHLDPGIVGSLPWESLRMVVLSADALAAGSTPSTIAAVAERAARHGIPVWWDLDLRPSSWASLDRYADAVAPMLTGASGVIGTAEEFAALYRLTADDHASIREAVQHSGFSDSVFKLGARGAVWWHDGREIHAPAATSEPVCTVGGGDATAGGLIAGRLAGLSRADALRLAMRVAAHTVQRPFCSTGFPTPSELGIEPLFRHASITGAP